MNWKHRDDWVVFGLGGHGGCSVQKVKNRAKSGEIPSLDRVVIATRLVLLPPHHIRAAQQTPFLQHFVFTNDYLQWLKLLLVPRISLSRSNSSC